MGGAGEGRGVSKLLVDVCDASMSDDGSEIPRCYFENSSKEELVLEHVLEYDNQFK